MQKTQEEIDQMTPEQRRAYNKEQRDIVFGIGHKTRGGKPVEQGLGSPAHPTANHVAALVKYYHEPDRDEVVAKAKKELLDYNAKRAAERDEEAA